MKFSPIIGVFVFAVAGVVITAFSHNWPAAMWALLAAWLAWLEMQRRGTLGKPYLEGPTYENCTFGGRKITWLCVCQHATKAEHEAARRKAGKE